jgi:TonB family protein
MRSPLQILGMTLLGACAALAQGGPAAAGASGPTAAAIINYGEADVKPVMTVNSPPVYPPQLRIAGIGGEALVDFVIEADGSTSHIRVLRRTNDAFGQAASDCVVKWRFSPGRKNGEVVRVHIQVPIQFAVDEGVGSAGGGTQPPEADIGPSEAVVDIGKVTIAPVAVYQARPSYPAELKGRKVTGKALISFIVRKDGRVSNVRAINATDPLFGSAGVAAVRMWRFHPAKQGDHIVNCQLQVPIMFSLNP